MPIVVLISNDFDLKPIISLYFFLNINILVTLLDFPLKLSIIVLQFLDDWLKDRYMHIVFRIV